MYLHSGLIKTKKKDIEEIQTFLHHAKINMEWGGNGSFVKLDSADNDTDHKELAKAQAGLRHIEFILDGLCPKWK